MKMKGTKVQYFGMDIQITTPFVAVDKNGGIYCYPEKPKVHGGFWVCDIREEYIELGIADLKDMDWKETLVEYAL